MSGWWVLPFLALGVYCVALAEEWCATGRVRLAAPLADGLFQFLWPGRVPRQADRLLFDVAPCLLLCAAFLAAAMLPLAPGSVVADLASGALFVNSALVYVMVALVMAGWGPNAAYALVGGWRMLGQLVAYSMLVVMPIAAVAMRASSLRTADIVTSQTPLWNLFAQPLGFVLFWLAVMAIAFLPPFDLPTAPGELAGGVESEYAGARLLTFRLGRLLLVVTCAEAVAIFFLGGWLGPLFPAWAWTSIKTLVVALAMLLVGRFVPRLPLDAVLAWAWKLGIPLALVNIAWVGITLLVVDHP